MRCFARLMRCAIVASGTRNALAISAVVSPPTARSVSAIAEAGVSAGWQHMNSTVSVSSWSETSARAAPAAPSRLSRCRRDCVASPLVDQPPLGGLDQPAARLLRNAVSRPVHGGREQRLLDGVLGGVEVAVPAHERAEDLRRQLAQQVLDARRHVQRSPPAVLAGTPPSRRRRTARRPSPAAPGSAAAVATPSGPGTAEIFAAISIARASDSTSTIW